jgi:hypothetical protein
LSYKAPITIMACTQIEAAVEQALNEIEEQDWE